MKLSGGFSKLIPSLLMFLFYGLSLSFTPLALKVVDFSIAYAILPGDGTALMTIVSIFYFNKPTTPLKIVSIGRIILGVIGLNWDGETG
jgi:small multidrug resistance pump